MNLNSLKAAWNQNSTCNSSKESHVPLNENELKAMHMTKRGHLLPLLVRMKGWVG